MNLRDFLKLNLSEYQQTVVRGRCPELSAALDKRGFTDADFAVRVIRRDEEALWLLWFVLHSSYFVRIIRMRSKHECGSPCNLVDFQTLPCRWSARVLEAFFQGLTSPESRLLSDFSTREEGEEGLLETLSIHLHEQFHVEMLGRHGFQPMDDIALPARLRGLFARDERYRTLFVNRWLWGLTELGVLADAIRPELPTETLLQWVEQVDEAVIGSSELELAQARLTAMRRLRLASGIPVRLAQVSPQR